MKNRSVNNYTLYNLYFETAAKSVPRNNFYKFILLMINFIFKYRKNRIFP